jgi:redox-sensitive bicupin YhaK (pirin superfamily)
MSIVLRPASQRGHFKNHWLDSRHTFSFGEYHDPLQMGLSDLRVINQDTVQGGYGFPMHRHKDMEIVSWILEGRLRHEDSMGHVSVVGPGGVQRLTAGSGMAHGEFNDSRDTPVQFLQIWILPRQDGVPASYEGKEFEPAALAAGFVCIAAPAGAKIGGATTVDQDAGIYVTRLGAGLTRGFELRPGRRGWVHLAKGELTLNGQALGPGDGAALENEKNLAFAASQDSEIVVFDLR